MMLERLHHPQGLKLLTQSELTALAKEIRQRLIETVSRTGGHLAANLGVVELTLALHCVFDSPRDQIVWDVGHQCYTHKLLTGRGDRFTTLRQAGGLSGFPSRTESEHDAFGTGHGSTAISAALGLAAARDARRDKHAVIAVVGDGGMTGGMAFEALNQAGHLGHNLIVVLNDNGMSISPNVGALAGYLGRLRLDPHYLRAKESFESLMHRLPLGETLVEAVDRFKSGVKQLLVPGMLFEELGFTYLGPIDGHHLPTLVVTLEQARECSGPVLIHVITTKGKGYSPAENDAQRFHGTPAFDVSSGEPLAETTGLSYSRVFGQTLLELARGDDRIVAITAAMAEGTGLESFAREFPGRFFDVGMAEQHAVTFAAGLAAGGLRPVVAIYSTFLQRAYDQILHDVCLQNLPVVLAIDRAGLVGEDGPTHQGTFDLSFLRPMPNLTVMAPKDLTELSAMLRCALTLESPCAVRYPRGVGANPPANLPDPVPCGQAEVLREGNALTLLAIGSMVTPTLTAAEMLAKEGLEAAVINARYLRPLDEATLAPYLSRGVSVITVEENALAGGFGSGVLELAARLGLELAKIHCLGLPDQFAEHAGRSQLLSWYGLTSEGITAKARALLIAESLA